VAAIRYSAKALHDLDRLVQFQPARDPVAAADAIDAIVEAIRVLERHPNIGRPVRGRLRELVISYGHTGHVALYRVSPRRDNIGVLAVRHQREADYQS
jgi:plasmid stabilization system protein ParE